MLHSVFDTAYYRVFSFVRNINHCQVVEKKNRDSSVGIALGYGLDDRSYYFRRGLGIFLFTTVSRTALGHTQPPIQGVPGALSLG
jgi:hypothetical protein